MIRDEDGPPFPDWPDYGPCPITEAIAEHREHREQLAPARGRWPATEQEPER
ncbi:hypothetical protein [Nocardia sp. NPDC058705]|uniref:hypothetical protein n=1 Tax=Nocardia sp. NPDC058705 TaxID=3346609 RepID=UPI0036927A21